MNGRRGRRPSETSHLSAQQQRHRHGGRAVADQRSELASAGTSASHLSQRRPSRAASFSTTKRPAPAATTGASCGKSVRGKNLQRRVLHRAELRLGEEAREVPPFPVLRLARVAADHAREPRRRGGGRLLPPVGGGMQVGSSGSTPRMRCTSAIEAKYSFITGVQAPRNGTRWRDRHQERPRGAGVDQLARLQPLRVADAARRDLAADDRHDVGRGRAHVDEERIARARAR